MRVLGLRPSRLPALLCLTLAAGALYLPGLRRELPYYYDGDERIFVTLAGRMAASADPNPRWFGNPGSTLLYPLAALARLDDLLLHGGPPRGPSPAIMRRFREDPSRLFLLGRGLSAGYAVSSFALLWLVGARAFSRRSAAAGTALALLCPLTMVQAQMVRTDGAGILFGLLGLWLCLRAADTGSARSHAIAGAAVGLAAATRYFLVVLLVPLLGAALLVSPVEPGLRQSRAARLRLVLAGLAASAFAFVLATPYFLLDLDTAVDSIRAEARTSHPLADGLSPLGNLGFYLGTVAPQELVVPVTALAAAGLLLAVARGRAATRLAAAFVVAFLLGISLSGLHWRRWLVPVLPLGALFAAGALEELLRRAPGRLRWLSSRRGFAGAVALLAVAPAVHTLRVAAGQGSPTTPLLAADWLRSHLPDGARVLSEPHAAPLHPRQQVLEAGLDRSSAGVEYEATLGERRVVVRLVLSLARDEGPEAEPFPGVTHLVAASGAYGPALESPDRYPEQSARYRALFSRSRVLARFEPSATRLGPTILVLEPPRAAEPAGAAAAGR